MSIAGHETGEDNVQVYRECPDSSGTGLVYKSVRPPHTSDPPGSLDGQLLLTPYPPLETLQQKRLAARRHKTTFCYDFPSVFQNALRDIWTERAMAGEPGNLPRGEDVGRSVPSHNESRGQNTNLCLTALSTWHRRCRKFI